MKMIWLLLKGSNEYFFDFWNLCNIFMNVEVVALQNRITHIVAIPSWLRNQSRYHIILKLLLWSNMVKYHNSHSNTSSQIISIFKRGLLTRHFRNTCIERNRDGVWPRLYLLLELTVLKGRLLSENVSTLKPLNQGLCEWVPLINMDLSFVFKILFTWQYSSVGISRPVLD